MVDPNIVIFIISGISLISGLIIFMFHLCNRKLHKNPCKYHQIILYLCLWALWVFYKRLLKPGAQIIKLILIFFRQSPAYGNHHRWWNHGHPPNFLHPERFQTKPGGLLARGPHWCLCDFRRGSLSLLSIRADQYPFKGFQSKRSKSSEVPLLCDHDRTLFLDVFYNSRRYWNYGKW